MEHIISNLNNLPLIRKVSRTFEHNLVNHIKGDSNFSLDPYDEELLNTRFDIREL